MIREDLLNRALRRSLRQVQIRHFERFRCKEPLAEELIAQFKEAVPCLCDKSSLPNLIKFTHQLKKWIDKKIDELNEYLGSSLLSPQPNIVNKPQPPFVSSVIATLIRFELLATYLPYIRLFDIGCILGGSLSYGKFFNIRQENKTIDYEKQSDIDLLMVADYEDLYGIIKKYTNSETSFSTFSSDHIKHFLYGLIPLFNVINQEKEEIDLKRTILSKKFRIESIFEVGSIFSSETSRKYSFPLSVHIVPKAVFDLLTNPLDYNLYKSTSESDNVLLYDMRLDSKLPPFMVYSIMEGMMVPESLSKVIKREQTISFGSSNAKLSICEMPAYFYWEDRFVSGIYQNLLLPQFEIIVDNREKMLKKGCDKFRSFLVEESLRELSVFRDSRLSLSNLHPRHIIFPNFVRNKIDMFTERHLTVDEKNIELSYRDYRRIEIRKQFHQKYRKDRSIYNRVESLIMSNDKQNVLDLGCGSGDFLHSLETSGHRGERVGIDLVNNWSERYSRNTATFLQGNIENLSEILEKSEYKCQRFDTIVAIHVLYHIKNIPHLLEEITSWLSDGGAFISTTNSNHNLFFINDLISQAMFNLKIGSLYDKKYNSFSAENALDILREYFSFVQNTVTESDFEIDDPTDVLDYLESNFDNYELPNCAVLRKKLIKEIEKLVMSKADHAKIKDRKVVALIIAKDPILIKPPISR